MVPDSQQEPLLRTVVLEKVPVCVYWNEKSKENLQRCNRFADLLGKLRHFTSELTKQKYCHRIIVTRAAGARHLPSKCKVAAGTFLQENVTD